MLSRYVAKMMKQIYKILFLIILISCEQKKEISPIFYEVKGENCKVYILGSIHSWDDSILPLPKFITDIFNECGKFIMELKPLEIDTSLSQNNSVEEVYNLKEHVSYETLQLVKDISKTYSIPRSILLSLQPLEIIQLVEEEELRKIGITINNGTEAYFYYLSYILKYI